VGGTTPRHDAGTQRGFASLEVLAAVTVVAIMLLSVATMYLTAQASVERSGDTTVAVALARQMLEAARALPYQQLATLDGLDTNSVGSLPTDDPARTVARRWRYALAGEGGGWSYTSTERAAWPTFATLDALRGQVEVASPSPSVRAVTVTIAVPGRPADVRLETLISRTGS
jgi:Tfp pilus assembly protein PilV